MNGVVPAEELLTVNTCVFDGAEAIREVGPVFQGLELGLRVRIVIRDVRPAVSLGDIQVDEESRDRLGSHAAATIGVQSQRAWCNVMFLDGVGEFSGFSCSLPIPAKMITDSMSS